MAEINEPPKITVEVPKERGNFVAISPTSQQSKLEKFRRGWQDLIALPDNLPDLMFDITAMIVVPALISSCWSNFRLPEFVQFGGIILLIVLALVMWQLTAIAEIRTILLIRCMLVVLGVILGL